MKGARCGTGGREEQLFCLANPPTSLAAPLEVLVCLRARHVFLSVCHQNCPSPSVLSFLPCRHQKCLPCACASVCAPRCGALRAPAGSAMSRCKGAHVMPRAREMGKSVPCESSA